MHFMTMDGMLICRIPAKNCIDLREASKIANHTVNTWQPDRKAQETFDNTVQGKMAEYVLEQYLEQQTGVRYLSYDKFRADNLEKHAPFDGLVYRAYTDPEILRECIHDINREVKENSTGQISEHMRELLETSRIFTLEVKSSQLRERDYEGVIHRELPREEEDYERIIENVRKWDYFVYPHFTRKSDRISTFYQYAEYVRQQNGLESQGNQEFLRNLILKEFRNASDIYTRLYFDYQSYEIIIPGYMTKKEFFSNPKIHKMPGDKSGQALYFMRSISKGSTFLEIDHDENIWDFHRENIYPELFGYQKKQCPTCGGNLQICNAKARGMYSYRCFDCNSWFSLDQINE